MDKAEQRSNNLRSRRTMSTMNILRNGMYETLQIPSPSAPTRTVLLLNLKRIKEGFELSEQQKGKYNQDYAYLVYEICERFKSYNEYIVRADYYAGLAKDGDNKRDYYMINRRGVIAPHASTGFRQPGISIERDYPFIQNIKCNPNKDIIWNNEFVRASPLTEKRLIEEFGLIEKTEMWICTKFVNIYAYNKL